MKTFVENGHYLIIEIFVEDSLPDENLHRIFYEVYNFVTVFSLNRKQQREGRSGGRVLA